MNRCILLFSLDVFKSRFDNKLILSSHRLRENVNETTGSIWRWSSMLIKEIQMFFSWAGVAVTLVPLGPVLFADALVRSFLTSHAFK